jgi:hypothetical protein
MGQFESMGGITVQVSCKLLNSPQAKSKTTTSVFLIRQLSGANGRRPRDFSFENSERHMLITF